MRRNAPCSCDSGKRYKDCCGAIREVDRTVRSEPLQIDAGSRLAPHEAAVSALDRRDFATAERLFRTAAESGPDDHTRRIGLSQALLGLRRFDEAEVTIRKVLADTPTEALAHTVLADVLLAKGEWKESLHQTQCAIEKDHALAISYVVIGDVYRALLLLDEAAESYRQALRFAPALARAHVGLGLCAAATGNLAEAVHGYRTALQSEPRYAPAYYHLGDLYQSVGDFTAARTYLSQCLALEPNHLVAACNLAFQESVLCHWDSSLSFSTLMTQAVENPRPGQAVSPFAFLTVPGRARPQLACAEQWVKDRISPVSEFYADHRFSFRREPSNRLRIGYFSADIAQHATSYLLAELFELHNRAQVEVYLYSFGPDDGSEIRRRIAASVDRFVDIRNASYIDSARRIHDDGIDILVDLKGYTKFSRPQVLALRPAPVQVNYLGYPGTMGADFIDYILVDEFITPPSEQSHFTEQFVYLPGCYQINDRRRPRHALTPPRQACSLPQEAFVYCCFNQTYKITPTVFASWMRILRHTPGSVLWLLQSHPVAAENLRRTAHAHGITPERLIFAPIVPLADHLARFAAADLFLDTFPVNAHTTASDALWVGVPVLTQAGETFVSRVAGSLLQAAGLPQLVTSGCEEYEALAIRLFQDRETLRAWRTHLESKRDTLPLFDSERFTRDLEAAYAWMWNQYLKN